MKLEKSLRLRRFDGTKIPVSELLLYLQYLPGHCEAMCNYSLPCGQRTYGGRFCYYHEAVRKGEMATSDEFKGRTKISDEYF